MTYNIIEDDKLIINVAGEEKECELLLSFECVQNGRVYIGFTDGTLDDEGNVEVTYASYYPESETKRLYEVTTEEEFEMIDQVLENIDKNISR